MKLLLYLSGNTRDAQRLQLVVEGAGAGHRIEICNGTLSLLRRLRRGTFDLDIVILFPSDRTSLSEILSIRHFLHDLRTILILPDRDSETVAGGLSLRPRYLTFADGDFSDVSAVLAKMLSYYGKESEGLAHSISKSLL